MTLGKKCENNLFGCGNMSADLMVGVDSVDRFKVKHKPVYSVISRLFDILSSLVSLVIGLPIVLVAAIAIKIEDGGPVLYSQVRLGKSGRVFTIYKMRSMRVDAEVNGARWAEIEDERITKVGKFIRKMRIDEIPQLYNVLVGHMKIIGPRPERPELAEEFYEKLPEFANRLVVKPGLTGWAQVSGGYDLSPVEKLVLDIEYIENRGFWLDLKILMKTIWVVFSGNGAR